MRTALLHAILHLLAWAAAASAQQWGSLDSDTGLLLTPPQQYSQQMIVPDRVTWNVKQFVRIDGGGTGSVIEIDGRPYIASCAHDHDGFVEMGQRLMTQSNRGTMVPAVVVAFDTEADCSLSALQCSYEAEPLVVATESPKAGEKVRAAGFPMGQQLRDRYTYVLKADDNQIHIRAAAIPGDSGGPILNERGELVGVLFGGDITECDQYGRPAGKIRGALCAGTGALHRLIARVRSNASVTQMQCYGGGCCQNGSCQIIRRAPANEVRRVIQQPPPPIQTPAPQPTIDRTAMDSQTAGQIQSLQAQLANLEKQLAQVKECDCDGCCEKLRLELNQRIETLSQAQLLTINDVRVLQESQPNYDAIAAEVAKRIPPIYMRVNPQAEYQPVKPGQYVTLPLDRQQPK